MNTPLRKWLLGMVIAGSCLMTTAPYAQNTDATPAPPVAEAPAAANAEETPAVEAPAAPEVEAADDAPDDANAPWRNRWPERWKRDRAHWDHDGDERVTIGGDSKLPKGESADSVVSIFGSSTSDGDVSDAVVSVLGDTRVTGTVGEAAVAVLGDNYVNGKVSGDVVAVLGNVALGPDADVGGNVVAVGGTVTRDPAAVVHGGVHQVLSFVGGSFQWLRPWVQHCLVYLRPLAIAQGLGWAWTLALGFLAVYVLIALLFRETVDECVRTLETRPGQTIVAALLAMLLTPVLFALLFITVIGIAFVPLAALGMFLAGAFGKVVVLAWIGRCCTKFIDDGASLHTAFAVLAGGVVVLVLYLVPVLGFVVYKTLGILGFGVAVYALILTLRARRGANGGPEPALASAGGGAGFGGGTSTGDYQAFADPASASYQAAPSSASGQGRGTSDDSGTSGTGGDTSASAMGGGASTMGAGASAIGGERASTAGHSGGPAAPGATGGAAMPASALPRAGLAVRIAALFIDAVLVAILLGVLHSSRQGELIALAIYGAVMWKFKGTTIGGIVFGLQVVRVDGRPIDWATAIVRALSCFLSLVVAGLGFIWIAFDEGRQAWHDKIAGTAVVRVPKGVSLL